MTDGVVRAFVFISETAGARRSPAGHTPDGMQPSILLSGMLAGHFQISDHVRIHLV